MRFIKRKERKNRSGRTGFYITIAVLLALAAAEFLFDIFEIGLGRLLYLTNPIRPQVGRLWEEDLKEQQGLEQLDATMDMEQTATREPLQNLDELRALLSIRRSMRMTRNEFVEFYKLLPVKQAKQLLDPLDLIELDRSSEWRSTQISLAGDQLVLYFLDGYDKPLKQTHFVIEESQGVNENGKSLLDHNARFAQRILSAAVFFRAFDQLPRSLRLQIVNDPYHLVRWGADLKRVGISRWIEEEGVEMAFEVADGAGLNIYTMFASPIAVEYLVNELRNVENAPELEMPVREKNADEKN